MWIHYANDEAARNHLIDNGWTELKSGFWVSKDRTTRASLHPIPKSAVVTILYEEIDTPRAAPEHG